ncbi:MAG TPA: response regulator [Nitrososphaeraceae archaeon]
MKILIADYDADIARVYKGALASRGHKVTIAYDAETCLKVYSRRLQEIYLNEPAYAHTQPFDTVILDYGMPDRNGLEIAKEILAINSRQRIIFVSAYVKRTLPNLIKKFSLPVELLQKPISNKVLIETIEDRAIYEELRHLNLDIETIRKAEFRHEQLRRFLYVLKIVLARGKL